MTTHPATSDSSISPAAPTPTEVVKISGPESLVSAVPYLLGFHPRESLVMLCMTGRKRRLGPVIRVDLPPDERTSPGSATGLAKYLALQASRHASSVALMCFTDHPNSNGSGVARFPRRSLIAACEVELRRRAVPLFDAMLVRDNTVWSYLQHEPGQPGYPLAGADDSKFMRLRAAQVSAGRAVLADRETLRASIQGPTGDAAAAAEAQLDAAVHRIATGIADIDRNEFLAAAGSTAARVLTAAMPRIQCGAPLIIRDAADLIAAMTSSAVRDEVIGWALQRLELPVLPLLIQLAAWTPDADSAQISAALALIAYRQGDGALAQVALDRAITAEPGHRLATLLGDLIHDGITPDTLDTLIRGGMPDDAGRYPS